MNKQHKKDCEYLLYDLIYDKWSGNKESAWRKATRLASMVSGPLDHVEGSMTEEDEYELDLYGGSYNYGGFSFYGG